MRITCCSQSLQAYYSMVRTQFIYRIHTHSEQKKIKIVTFWSHNDRRLEIVRPMRRTQKKV